MHYPMRGPLARYQQKSHHRQSDLKVFSTALPRRHWPGPPLGRRTGPQGSYSPDDIQIHHRADYRQRHHRHPDCIRVPARDRSPYPRRGGQGSQSDDHPYSADGHYRRTQALQEDEKKARRAQQPRPTPSRFRHRPTPLRFPADSFTSATRNPVTLRAFRAPMHTVRPSQGFPGTKGAFPMKKSMAVLPLLALAGAALTVPAQADGFGRSSDYVYVESNVKTPNGNSVLAYARGVDGRLTPIPGSPFLTGGAGTQYAGLSVGPPDTDQDLITNREGTLLFVVNSGSDSVAVFHIGRDGGLNPVPGSPFPSGGNNPVSLELVGDTLFIANKSGDFGRPSSVLPNYTTLRVQYDGTLVPFKETANDTSYRFPSTVSVAAGSSPTQIHAVPGTDLLLGIDFLGGLIQRFQFDYTGGLRQLSPLALPASEYSDITTPRYPLGLWHHPSEPLVYVGLVTANKLAVYRYSPNGNLTLLRTVSNSGKALCWVRVNRAGNRLYTSDTMTNSVSVYDLSDPEYPVEIQNFVLQDPGNVLQFSLSADERFLYALATRGSASIPEGQGNELHSLSVARDGRLSETVTPVPIAEPNDTRPQGVATIPAH